MVVEDPRYSEDTLVRSPREPRTEHQLSILRRDFPGWARTSHLVAIYRFPNTCDDEAWKK